MTKNPMFRKLRAILTLLLVGVTGWVVWSFGRRAARPAVAASGPDALWVVDDGVRLKRDAAPVASNAIWDGQTIKLFAMRNEVVAWQVAIRPGSPVLAIAATVDPLVGPGGARLGPKQVAIYREHYLEVTVPSQVMKDDPVPLRMGPGWFPEQCLPLRDGATVDAQANQVTALWYDLWVPADAAPGRYTGRVKIDGGSLAAAWDLELEVLPLTMPRETHFRTYFYYGPEKFTEFYGLAEVGSLLAVERAFQQLAHDHRMTLGTEAGAADGHFNWRGWWARYGGYLTGSAFDSGPCQGAGATSWNIGIAAEASREAFTEAAKSTVAFFSAKKVLDKIFFGCWDEPGDAHAYQEIRRIGAWVDAAVGNRLPTMVTETIQPEKPEWGSLLDAVDIFCGVSSEADLDLVRRRGGQVWTYNGGYAGAPLLDCPLLGMTAWGPAAWRYGLDGWYYWDTTYWRQKHFGVKTPTDLYADPLTFDETRRKRDGKPYPADWALRLNGDGVLLYPGEPVGVPGPVAGLRMKAFRRGAQDYEYLWLLAKQGRRAQADAFSRRLAQGPNQYEQNPDTWQQVRREMADALLGTAR